MLQGERDREKVTLYNHPIFNVHVDKATTSSDDTKRRNIASSAKTLDSVDSDESMEVDVTSLEEESTNQTKEAINSSLNLQREPLQKTSGEKRAKGTVHVQSW